jgi:hypothetical protein
MKHFFLAIFAFAILLPVHTQDPEPFTDKKNEINIGFFNAFELSNVSDFGVGYKRMNKNGAWRFGTGIGLSASNSDSDYSGLHTIKYYNVSPRIGYEWHQNFNRLQLQYGTDVVAKFFNRTIEEMRDDPDYYNFEEIKHQRYSLRPFLGLKVFITKSISLSTETFLDIAYSYQSFKENNNLGSNTTRTEKGSSIMLGPLGVFSVNIHF